MVTVCNEPYVYEAGNGVLLPNGCHCTLATHHAGRKHHCGECNLSWPSEKRRIINEHHQAMLFLDAIGVPRLMDGYVLTLAGRINNLSPHVNGNIMGQWLLMNLPVNMEAHQ